MTYIFFLYKICSLFAGVGGIDLGFLQTKECEVVVYYQSPNLYRVELTNAGNNEPQIMIKNADGTYVLLPAVNKIFKKKDSKENEMFWYLVIATVPGALFGFLLDDFIENNRAYVFTIANGTVDASSCREVAYGSKLGQIGGLYEFGSQRIWAGGKGKTVTVFNESYTQTGTFSMPISGTNVAAIYGLDTFEVRNHEYVSYVQVVDRNKSYLQVYELNEGTNFTAAMTGAVSVASYEYNTEGINTQPCGDVATYSDGSKAYIAVVATGYGITLYSME